MVEIGIGLPLSTLDRIMGALTFFLLLTNKRDQEIFNMVGLPLLKK